MSNIYTPVPEQARASTIPSSYRAVDRAVSMFAFKLIAIVLPALAFIPSITVVAAPSPQEVTGPGIDANTNAVTGSTVYIVNDIDPPPRYYRA